MDTYSGYSIIYVSCHGNIFNGVLCNLQRTGGAASNVDMAIFGGPTGATLIIGSDMVVEAINATEPTYIGHHIITSANTNDTIIVMFNPSSTNTELTPASSVTTPTSVSLSIARLS